ncbi:uncharacterized protein [Littorina saxatilis]|uniref:uncharacterized protein n=1 Tax=Littorina saxatilis TaxID=31220 RepID=UPI0038B46D3C
MPLSSSSWITERVQLLVTRGGACTPIDGRVNDWGDLPARLCTTLTSSRVDTSCRPADKTSPWLCCRSRDHHSANCSLCCNARHKGNKGMDLTSENDMKTSKKQ